MRALTRVCNRTIVEITAPTSLQDERGLLSTAMKYLGLRGTFSNAGLVALGVLLTSSQDITAE